MSKRVLMLVGEFSEEYEIFVFQQALEAVGHQVDIVCPDTAKGYRLKTSVHDFGMDGVLTYTEHRGHDIAITRSFDAVDTADYDAVYIAGGRGPEYIRTFPRVQAIVREFHRDGKPIASICHGVQVLVAVPEVIEATRRRAVHLRAGGRAHRRHVRQDRPDRRAARRQSGERGRLDGARRLHPRSAGRARHRDRPSPGRRAHPSRCGVTAAGREGYRSECAALVGAGQVRSAPPREKMRIVSPELPDVSRHFPIAAKRGIRTSDAHPVSHRVTTQLPLARKGCRGCRARL